MEKKTTITLRVEKSIKDEFEKLCKADDLTMSQAIRKYMKQEIDKQKNQPKSSNRRK